MKFLTAKIASLACLAFTFTAFSLPISVDIQKNLNSNEGVHVPSPAPTTEPTTGVSFVVLPGVKPSDAPANRPTILVHGFAGFAHQKGIIDYWGGFYEGKKEFSFQKELIKGTNSPVFVAEVGPFNSNFDRAVELFAQIKGSCVIYGKASAQLYGHLPYYPQKNYSPNYISSIIDMSAYKQSLDGSKSLDYDYYEKPINYGSPHVRCFPGFYPQWDDQHPINLIGHSQGGQTIRYLVALLNSKSNSNVTAPNPMVTPTKQSRDVLKQKYIIANFKSDPIVKQYLFCHQGATPNTQTDCTTNMTALSVHSVTTVSTPHMGTTLTTPFFAGNSFLKNTAVFAIGNLNNIIGDKLAKANLFDFWFDLWELEEDPLEASKQKFYGSSKIYTPLTNAFYSTNDFSAFDLSPIGAETITKAMGEDAPNVYYYSFATQTTNDKTPIPFLNFYYGLAHILDPVASLITFNSKFYPDPYIKSNYAAWAKNDGIVNTVSMISPRFKTENSFSKLATTPYNFKTAQNSSEHPLKGQWNYVGLLPGVNHLNSVGWLYNNDKNNISAYHKMKDYFIYHINYINSQK